MISFDFLFRLVFLMVSLMLVGSIICLPLYKWRVREFVASSLFTKIIWWIPIFGVLLLILYGGLATAITATILIALIACREFVKNHGYKSKLASLYFIIFLIALSHLGLWFVYLPLSAATLAVVCVISVLSDVFAFFLGNYVGKHKLPRWINNHKSWEGVAGQMLGAALGGVLALGVLHITLPLLLIIAIGVASAVGDLINSIAKRQLNIKDWGRTIPGHGGVLDRLSSLSLALAVSMWLLYTFSYFEL